jgi:DNA-nicking Smr family endonuclease
LKVVTNVLWRTDGRTNEKTKKRTNERTKEEGNLDFHAFVKKKKTVKMTVPTYLALVLSGIQAHHVTCVSALREDGDGAPLVSRDKNSAR